MPRISRTKAAGHPRIGWRWFIVALAGASALLVWAGCSPMERYKVLKIFFDRPPLPPELAATRPTTAPSAMADGTAGGRVVHAPFAQKRCEECHVSSPPALYELSAVRVDTCVRCHPQVLTAKRLHEPVQRAECLWCHHPHESLHASLLRDRSPEICTQCHDRQQISRKCAGRADVRRGCLTCHRAHDAGLKDPAAGPSSRPVLSQRPTPGPQTAGGEP